MSKCHIPKLISHIQFLQIPTSLSKTSSIIPLTSVKHIFKNYNFSKSTNSTGNAWFSPQIAEVSQCFILLSYLQASYGLSSFSTFKSLFSWCTRFLRHTHIWYSSNCWQYIPISILIASPLMSHELKNIYSLVVSTPLKNISQIGSSSQLLGKIKAMFQSPPTRYI